MSEIFIVDDDPLVDTALAKTLNSEGFNVVNFVEGKSFLNVARIARARLRRYRYLFARQLRP